MVGSPFRLWGEAVPALRDFYRAPKTKIKIGQWRSGKVPRADFPIGRAAYNLGSSFRWCVITFETLACECRVLVIMNEAKQKLQAVLGVMGSSGLRILCTYEYHPSEPGWHTHATHDDADALSRSYMRGPWIKRLPGQHKKHRDGKFSSLQIGDETAAQRFAIDRYRIREKGSLL
jgi:hypothetical protein